MNDTTPPDLKQLATHLATIQDVALRTHETLERTAMPPILELEASLVGAGRTLDLETRARVEWALLLFSTPRYEVQSDFQTELGKHIHDAETALIMRQLRSRAPRLWSYRRSYDRGFAHTMAGPQKHHEIALDGFVYVDGTFESADHLYALGWTLSYHDRIFLICADVVSQAQAFSVETVRPFPLQLDDDDFWDECFHGIFDVLYPSRAAAGLVPRRASLPLPDSPELRYGCLQRILIRALSPAVVRRSPSLHEIVATGSPQEILAAVDSLIQVDTASAPLDEQGRDVLRRRLLQAVGCDETAQMPCAHDAILAADPVALLCLPGDLPLFREIAPRDSIRHALLYDERHGSHEAHDAFAVYQRERRFLASFPCLDVACEEHAARLGLPADVLHRIFDPALFETVLPIVPQGDVLRQLQSKFGFYSPDPPVFKDALDAVASRSLSRTGNMSAILQWIFTCCERWRYCRSQIDPDTASTQRSVNQSNQKLLHRGLSRLADMFKKN